jgi:hypothetical protein
MSSLSEDHIEHGGRTMRIWHWTVVVVVLPLAAQPAAAGITTDNFNEGEFNLVDGSNRAPWPMSSTGPINATLASASER